MSGSIWGFVGVLVGAAIAASANYSIARWTRQSTTQVDALCRLQDQVRDLREQYRSFGALEDFADKAKDEEALLRAKEAAELTCDRIRCCTVRRLYKSWSKTAGWVFDGDDLGPEAEETAWDALRKAIRVDLRRLGA